MKLKLFSSLAIAAMMFAGTSCSSEEVVPASGESTVTLSVTLPDGIQSRAYGDGYTAKSLNVVVLDQNNNMLPVFENNVQVYVTDINKTKQLNLRLAAGKTYKVVCWACSANSPFIFHTNPLYVYTDYEGVLTNDENLDAFYAAQDITVTGNMTETIKLYRPFAQLNIGTDDLAAAKAAGFELQTVSVKAPAYKRFNLLTGDVVNDAATVNFGENTLPQGETFPKDGYEYVAMNYLLMSADKQLVDIEFTMKAADGTTRTIPVTGVPVQRNYRTNIYGSLLTNSVNINVEIIPDFETPDYEQVSQDPVTSQAEFEEAVKVEGASVVVGKDMTVTLPQDIANGVTIIGMDGATIDNTIFKHWDGNDDNCIYDKENLTFKNLNIKENNVDYAGMVRCNNVTYDNCTITGKMFLNGKGFVFESCKFVQTVSDYNIWTYGGNPATFRNCEFVSKGKTVHVYREGSTGVVQKYVFENCKFTASGFLAKGAINIKAATGQQYDIVLTNCTATGCKLWQIDNTGTGLVNLTIDGVTTQP